MHIVITKKGNQEQTMLKIHWQDTYLTNSKNLPMGDGRPTCNSVLTSGSVGMGIPVGMGWVWGLKCHPHGSPDFRVRPTKQKSLEALSKDRKWRCNGNVMCERKFFLYRLAPKTRNVRLPTVARQNVGTVRRSGGEGCRLDEYVINTSAICVGLHYCD